METQQMPLQLRFECLCRTCMHEVAESVAIAATMAWAAQEHQQEWQSLIDAVAECGTMRIAELLSTAMPQLHVQSGDELPQRICRECLEQLLSVHKFQQMCLESDKEMRKLLQHSEVRTHVVAAQKQRDTNAVTELAVPVSAISPHLNDFAAADPLLQCDDNVATKVSSHEEEGEVLPIEMHTFLKMEMDEPEYIKGDTQLETLTDDSALLRHEGGNIEVKKEILPQLLDATTTTKADSGDSDSDDMPLQRRYKLHRTNAIENLTNAETLPGNAQLSFEATNIARAIGGSFACTQCTKTFSSTRYLNKHLKRHRVAAQRRNEPPKPAPETYTCDECPRRYTKLESLHKHQQTHDPNAVSTPPTLDFACDICPKKYSSRRMLTKHKHTHDEIKDKTVQKQYVCEFCNKSFQQSCTLKDHLRIHTGEQPYLCSECGKAFNSSSNMKQHLLRHSGVKRYECPDCPKKFPCPSDLASHRAVHRTIKPHICDLCGAAFGKPYQLKKHKMYHNGEKPHKCEYCDMRFVCTDHMRRHMRTHTGEKPYKCKYCERAFAQSNDLIKHLRSHLGENVYRCELCPSAFRLATELRKHFTVHKNEDDETRELNMQALMAEEAKFRLNMAHKNGQVQPAPSIEQQTYLT